MRIIVRSKGVRLWLPVPLSLAAASVRLLPGSVLEEMRASVPRPYDVFVTKDFLLEIMSECRSILKQYKGLEIVHVETRDGAYVSIRL